MQVHRTEVLKGHRELLKIEIRQLSHPDDLIEVGSVYYRYDTMGLL